MRLIIKKPMKNFSLAKVKVNQKRMRKRRRQQRGKNVFLLWKGGTWSL
jgi:hypothetical protein